MTIKSFALCDLREDSRASLRNSVALRTIDDDWKALGSSRVPRKPRGLRGVRPKRMRLLRDPQNCALLRLESELTMAKIANLVQRTGS